MLTDSKILKNDERAVFALRSLYRRYGYLAYKMSRFEEYDLYIRNKDFLISQEFITFPDKNGKLLALKPDVTLSIIKNAPDLPGVVQKVYYNENVYRADSATHAVKEILQTGLECVGDLGDYEIGEVVLLAAKSLDVIGGRYVLDISHMGLISAILRECGLSEAGKNEALTFLCQKNRHELERLCQTEGISPARTEKLCALVALSGPAAQVLPAIGEKLTTDDEKEAWTELSRLCAILDAQGFSQAVRVDFSVGNDMKYYSGVVFKGYLEGIPSSILSGGQYDKLLEKMGRSSSAIGFAIYVNLLEKPEPPSEIDTVLLHDEHDDPAKVLAAAQRFSGEGSVLVTSSLPKGRAWRRLWKYQEGEAVLLEDNG